MGFSGTQFSGWEWVHFSPFLLSGAGQLPYHNPRCLLLFLSCKVPDLQSIVTRAFLATLLHCQFTFITYFMITMKSFLAPLLLWIFLPSKYPFGDTVSWFSGLYTHTGRGRTHILWKVSKMACLYCSLLTSVVVWEVSGRHWRSFVPHR